MHKECINVNGIGGQLQTEGFVYISLSIKGQEFKHKFYVLRHLPCSSDGIIGQDFLKQYNGVVNYENNTLTLSYLQQKYSLPLTMGSLGNNNFLKIPARCEKIFKVKTSITEECVVAAQELCKGVFIAGSICKPSEGHISIQILNTRDNEVGLSYFRPEIDKLADYSICSFEKNSNIDGSRVRQMFQLLKLDHLNKEERTSIQNICAKFSDIFYLPGDNLTTTNLPAQNIQLKPNSTPAYTKQYRLPFSQREELENQVQKMLSDDIIEPAKSDWSSPVLLVPKKSENNTKKWRLVIDFRKLNNTILDDKFPLPNITDILDSLSGSIYFSQLDLTQAYYQVGLDPESRKYTAFTTPSGQYQMKRLPMGLKISPSSFSRVMTIAMSGLNYEKTFVYLDNLICFGRNLEIHNKNLMEILTRLRTVNLKLNPEKCDFLRKEILYLGHVVSADGIKPDPEKTRVLKDYPVPKNADEVKRFVAFTNYYRKFIPNFAEICYPLNNLSRKNVVFDWNEECEKSFRQLKDSLTTPPVLQYPNFDENNVFILKTDASGFSIGSLLCNSDNRPIAYASRTLNKAEKRYPTIEKELLSVVWSVKYFRPYLYGRKFRIETDHKPLVYLFGMTDPSNRLMKFRLLLEEYDFIVDYVKGPKNVAADALSRICVTSDELKSMNESILSVLTRAQSKKLNCKQSANPAPTDISTHDWTDHPRVVEMLKLPKNYTELIFMNENKWNNLSKIGMTESRNMAYLPSKNVIYMKTFTRSHSAREAFAREMISLCNDLKINTVYIIKDKDNERIIKEISQHVSKMSKWSGPRLCIIKGVTKISDSDTKRVILNDYHMLPTSGHAGIRRMIKNIKQKYFWHGLESDVTSFVNKCDKCQRHKYLKPIKQPMTITNVGNSAFDRIYLDLVGPVVKDYNSYCYILTLQCDLTKYVEAYPITCKDAATVASALVNNFILRYGIPREIITDRGTEFINSTMTEICKILKINKLSSTAYRHQTLGSLENTHKHLSAFLRMQIHNQQQQWSSWLPFWCFSYNTTIHSETNYTPYELVFGKHCNLPSNLTTTIDPLYNYYDYPLELKYRLQKSQFEAKTNLCKSKELRKIRYDSYVNPIKYKPGDLVLIKKETGTKFDPLYVGPYTVIGENEPNVVIIDNGKEIHIHKNRTRRYNS